MKHSHQGTRRAFGVAAASLLSQLAFPPSARGAESASAAPFPVRPLKFIVPFPSGSGSDVAARYFAQKISIATGQPVVVDNRAGGNGFIGVRAVTAAPADGYTVLVASNSVLATNVALFRQLPYDPQRDLVPVSGMVHAPFVLIVPAGSPYKNLNDLVAAARTKPGACTVGTGSAGYQLAGEMFAANAQVKLLNVPFKGSPDVITATIAGEVDVGVAEVSSTAELIRNGRLRALAVASAERVPLLPDVPTALELGVKGFVANAWTAAAVAAGTPKAIVDKLSDLFVGVLGLPETQKFVAQRHMLLMKGGQDALRVFQHDQIDAWKRIAASANIELQ